MSHPLYFACLLLPQLTRLVIVVLVPVFVGMLLVRGLDMATIAGALTGTTVMTGQLVRCLFPRPAAGEV